MTSEELANQLKSWPVILAFDTNAIYQGQDRWLTVMGRINSLPARRSGPIRTIVSSLVHGEVLLDLRQKYGSEFSAALVVQSMLDLDVEVVTYDVTAADATADHIGRSCPTGPAWHAAKKANYMGHLHVGATAVPAEITGRNCSATIDWFIAGHAAASGAVLVTNDKGIEFASAKRVSIETLEAALTIAEIPS